MKWKPTEQQAEVLRILAARGPIGARTSTSTIRGHGIDFPPIVSGVTATSLERRGLVRYRGPGVCVITDAGRDLVAGTDR